MQVESSSLRLTLWREETLISSNKTKVMDLTKRPARGRHCWKINSISQEQIKAFKYFEITFNLFLFEKQNKNCC